MFIMHTHSLNYACSQDMFFISAIRQVNCFWGAACASWRGSRKLYLNFHLVETKERAHTLHNIKRKKEAGIFSEHLLVHPSSAPKCAQTCLHCVNPVISNKFSAWDKKCNILCLFSPQNYFYSLSVWIISIPQKLKWRQTGNCENMMGIFQWLRK